VEVSKTLPCKARVIWRRPDCLKPSHQRCKRHTPRHGALCRGHRHRTIPTFVVSTLPVGGRQATSLFKGTDRAAYVTLDTSNARGIRDGLRGESPTVTECP
jgi:hypothetical protein